MAMRRCSGLLAALLLFAAAPLAFAQAWPSKPVRVIVNVAPGGAVDQITRPLAARLAEAFGQPFLVEYRAGAGGSIGIEAVAKSPADGHTLLSSAGTPIVVNPHLYAKLAADPAKDIEPVAPTARVSLFLVVRPGLAAKSVAELVALAKAQPGKLSFGSAGHGTAPHVGTEMFLRAAGIRATHVPYKGVGPALADLLGGHLDFLFDAGPSLPHVKADKLRLLAVATGTRLPGFPDVPTLAELGVPIDADTMFGIYAPAGTPRDIVVRLNREIGRVMQSAELRTVLAALGAEPMVASPEEFAVRLHRDRERFGIIVREANIRIE
jgi:tripartite-type tricarboxylate transporter receptor subunit TctC